MSEGQSTVTLGSPIRLLRNRATRRLSPGSRGASLSIVVCLSLLVAISILNWRLPSYFSIESILNAGAPLVLASFGQTIVLIGGGFDLSAGAVVGLVNALLATCMAESPASQVGVAVACLLAAGLIGAVNGLLIAVLRLQPIIVTLATMFVVKGITLLVLPGPGGAVPESFSEFFTGDLIANRVPSVAVVITIACGVWIYLRNTRLGTAIFAIGSDELAARWAGIDVVRAKVCTYAIGGLFYGAAGIFITAQGGGGDPLIGNPLLLATFTAAVLGGTTLGGGRGSCIGTIFGAYTIMLVVNLLLSLHTSDFYSSVIEGIILLVAILMNPPPAPIGETSEWKRFVSWAAGRMSGRTRKSRSAGVENDRAAHSPQHQSGWLLDLSLGRVKRTATYVLPAWVCLAIIVAMTVVMHWTTFEAWTYVDRLLVLTSFLALLALGQGVVVMAGGFDFSVTWVIGLSGILLCTWAQGSDFAAVWVAPIVLAIGLAVGLANGLGVVVLGIPPIIMTLATNAILQGATLIYTQGSALGLAPPAVRWFATGHIGPLAPISYALVAFAILATIFMSATPFGRRVLTIGANRRASHLAGVPVGRTIILTYGLCGICSSAAGILLAGYIGGANLTMGDGYLLPTIAAVVIGGTLITGGRGHYLGILGGCLLLVALQVFLAGTSLPFAVRDIVYGCVILGAIVALRDRPRT